MQYVELLSGLSVKDIFNDQGRMAHHMLPTGIMPNADICFKIFTMYIRETSTRVHTVCALTLT